MSQPQSFGTTPGAELTAALIDTMTQIRVLNAEMLDIIAEMNREHVAQDAGYSSLAAYLTEATHMARTRATRMVAQAALVTETVTPTGHVTPAPLPTAREALREGLVDGEHLDAIAKTLEQLPDTATMADRELVESTLASTARTSEPHVVRKHGEILLAHHNADGPEPTESEPTQPANSFRYQRTRDGGMKYTGRLGHEASEELLSVLGPLAKPQSPLPGVPDPRSEAERNGDALADLIHGALTGGVLPNRGGEKPHLNLLIDYNKLLDGLGIATGDGGQRVLPGGGAPARLRRRTHPDRAQRSLPAVGCGPQTPAGQPRPTPRSGGPGPGLRLPWVPFAAAVDRRPPHSSCTGSTEAPPSGQPGPAMSAAPQTVA